MSRYVIAASQDWFRKYPKSDEFNRLDFVDIVNKDDLNFDNLKSINPEYIFFPHWSWRVSSDIYNGFECVVFHTAPLPYGRGGSPIQNLILRGFEKSPVFALKMTDVLDGGPLYDSVEVTLNGSLADIFFRVAKCIEELILRICSNKPMPSPQVGNVVSFRRLSYDDNEILECYTMKEIYDRVRMVDGDGYRKAYLKFGDYKIELSESSLVSDELHAKIRMYKNTN